VTKQQKEMDVDRRLHDKEIILCDSCLKIQCMAAARTLLQRQGDMLPLAPLQLPLLNHTIMNKKITT